MQACFTAQMFAPDMTPVLLEPEYSKAEIDLLVEEARHAGMTVQQFQRAATKQFLADRARRRDLLAKTTRPRATAAR